MEMDGEEMERDVLGARRVLQDRQDGCHCSPNVVNVEGHYDVDDVFLIMLGACVAVAEGGSLTEGRDDGGRGGGVLNDIEADGGGGGGGGGVEEDERQEAEEGEKRREGAP